MLSKNFPHIHISRDIACGIERCNIFQIHLWELDDYFTVDLWYMMR